MAYTVLARRYRSLTFDDVVGQNGVAQTLKNAIQSQRVAHAYLFTGTRGVGKTTMARILAKSLNCLASDGPTIEPCLECDSCVSINAGDDIDVIEIDGASNTGVDNIRQLRQNAIYRPARARYKIYIIDEVHMLSTGAFNALLKILEEPPEHVKFIFATTDPNKVLPTIQSRCQRFDFHSISAQDIADQLGKILKLEKITYQNDLVIHLARLANGSMRDGLSILDQLISTGYDPLTVGVLQQVIGTGNTEQVSQLLMNIGSSDAAATLNKLDELLREGSTATQILDNVIDIMRDLMVIKSTDAGSDLLVLTGSEREYMVKLADLFDIPSLIYGITSMEKLRWTLRNSDNPRALLEASMLRLALSEHFMGIPQLLKQVESGNFAGGARAAVKKNAESLGPLGGVPGQKIVDVPQGNDKAVKPQFNISGRMDFKTISSSWPVIMESLKSSSPSFGSFLEQAAPSSFTGNTLTVVFPESAEFALTLCRSKQKIIEDRISEITGRGIQIKFEKGNLPDKKTDYRPPGAKTSQKINDQILQDPSVQKIITGLKASVMQIEQIGQ